MSNRGFSYVTLGTPIGGVLVAQTEGAFVQIAFEGEDWDVTLAELAKTIELESRTQAPVLGQAKAQLTEYFAGPPEPLVSVRIRGRSPVRTGRSLRPRTRRSRR